jgi:hypothetical protein
MIIDSLLEFSDAQALTATADSTNVVDLSSDRDVGPGEPLYLVVQVDVALDYTTMDETYVVELETDDNAAMTSSTIIGTLTFTGGDAAGTRQYLAVGANNEQYLQVVYTLGGTTPTGTFSAWLTPFKPESWASFPDAAN